MPFDGSCVTVQLNRAMLIDALRSPEIYAPDWDFSNYEHCAVAVAARLGLPTPMLREVKGEQGYYTNEVVAVMASGYGLDPEDAERIFTGRWPSTWPCELAAVTPAMVADRLEAAP